MRAWPNRAGCAVLAALATVWALFLLPQQTVVWAGSAAPEWAIALTRMPLYRGIRAALADAGLLDLYLMFGAAVALSYVLLWLAMGPALARVGWTGKVYGALLLVLAVVIVLSYVNHGRGAPLRFMWGWEGILLILLGVWGIVAAFAPGARRLPLWEALTLGLTLPIFAVATFVSSYYPHGPAIALGLVAIAFGVWAPRVDEERAAQERVEAAVSAG